MWHLPHATSEVIRALVRAIARDVSPGCLLELSSTQYNHDGLSYVQDSAIDT